jgi:acetyltransferase-like isoleucine patch superfamily enzyme
MSASGSAKLAVFALAAAIVAPLWAAAWLEHRLRLGSQMFRLGAELLALAPGLPGAYLRGAYYAVTLERCSWETHIGFGSVFVRRTATLGRHASMGCYCVIGNADIGEGAMIGSRVSVPSGRRQHLGDDGRPSAVEGHFDRVSIGAGCWIGEGAIVMADVGQSTIVAAGAVVSSPMPGGAVVGGNPARVLRAAASASEDV